MEVFKLVGRLVIDGTKAVANQLRGVGEKAKSLGNEFEKAGDVVNQQTERMGDSVAEAAESVEDYREQVRKAFQQQREAMKPLLEEQRKNEKAWIDMARAAKEYTGSTREFIQEVYNMGKADKAVTDQMMKNNELAKAGFLQSVGAMLNRSGQSEKIAQNFERMGNPLYTVNNALLAVTDGLERMARAGQPAVLALKMLGPTSSMKELNDMTRMISQGLVRFQAVALASAIALGVLTAALVNAAYGPNPAKVRADIAEVEAIYDEALEKRKQEIYEWAGLFENVDIKVFDHNKLLKNLEEQVGIMRNWMQNLATLARRGVDEGLIAELEKMGPAAAGEIKALTTMSDSELARYVALWQEKHALAREQATSELEELRAATDAQIQKLQESITPLALAWEKFQQTWASALGPFVESFGRVAAKVVDAGTAIGEFFNKLNEINPMITTVIGWFTFIFTALTLLLSPLAIGIGLVGGFAAAWASLAPIVMPLLTGLAAMSGTIALVTAGILLAIGIIGLFVTAFKNWIAGSEEAQQAWTNFTQGLQEKANQFLTPLKDLFGMIMGLIKGAVSGALTEIQAFWTQHGTQILAAVDNFLNVLLAIWNFIFPAIKFIVLGVIQGIVLIFQGFVDTVMGIINIFSGLFTGNWSLMWEGIKQLFWGAIQIIWGWLSLSFFGRILKGVGSFVSVAFASFRGFFTNLINAARGMVTNVTTWFSNLQNAVITRFHQIRTFGGSIWQALSGAIQKAWSTIWSTVTSFASRIYSSVSSTFNSIKTAMFTPIESARIMISSALERIKSLFSGLKLTFPKPKVPVFSVRTAYKSIAGLSVPYPDIDVNWKARGGLFDGPSIIGIGEKTKEAAIPLEGRHMRPFAEAIASQIPADVDRGNLTIEVPLYLDRREFARATATRMNTELERERRITNRGRGLQT